MSGTKERRISAAEFKATCLALLDDVAATRRSVLVTKRGRPVARLVPVERERCPLEGSILAQGDLVSPNDEEWDAER